MAARGMKVTRRAMEITRTKAKAALDRLPVGSAMGKGETGDGGGSPARENRALPVRFFTPPEHRHEGKEAMRESRRLDSN